MNLATLIEKIQRLPEEKQAEVFDFIDYLSSPLASQAAHGRTEWSECDFSLFSMTQALRGMEDEPDIYSQADLKERW